MQRRTVLYGLAATLMSGLSARRAAAKGSQMIIVTVEVEFEDDAIHRKIDAIRTMDAATAAEAGCLAYRTSFDATNPRIMRIYEMWQSMDALVPHFKTKHMADFQAALSGLKPKGMVANVYEVARELPFPN